MALSVAQANIPSGVYVVGRFGGMVGERYPKLRVLIDRDGDDGPATTERDLDVRADLNLLEAIQQIEKGDRIAVAVYTDAREFTYKRGPKEGQSGVMAILTALSVSRLDG